MDMAKVTHLGGRASRGLQALLRTVQSLSSLIPLHSLTSPLGTVGPLDSPTWSSLMCWISASARARQALAPLWDFTWLETATTLRKKTRLDDKQTYQLQSAFSVRETLKLQKGRLVSLLNVLFSKLVQPIILGLEGVEGLCTQWQHMATYPRLL